MDGDDAIVFILDGLSADCRLQIQISNTSILNPVLCPISDFFLGPFEKCLACHHKGLAKRGGKSVISHVQTKEEGLI